MPILFCTAFGIVAGVPAGPMMALPSRILGPEHRALGLGVFYTAFYIVFTSGPALGGVARDAFGTAAPIMLAAAFFMAILPMQLLLRRLEVPEPAVATT
jgi:predicted MFS family arabinose efflux permease